MFKKLRRMISCLLVLVLFTVSLNIGVPAAQEGQAEPAGAEQAEPEQGTDPAGAAASEPAGAEASDPAGATVSEPEQGTDPAGAAASEPEESGTAEPSESDPAGSTPDTEQSSGRAGVAEGVYHFTSTKDENRQMKDHFIYSDEWFKASSFTENTDLMVLSAQAAMASVSWYGYEIDHFEKDYTLNSHNIVGMLEDMGFSDIEENAWYSLEKKENSMAAVIGRRTVETDEGSFTLLAIIPRSGGYKAEWVGDMTIGSGDIHEGFRAARDEVLRFTRQYLARHDVSGSLKLWMAGHSRGAAVSNLVAAFFAGGGLGYFDREISVRPEDIYCYGFATPGIIKKGASKAQELSVSADRGGDYEADTPSEAFVSDAQGTLDPRDEVYSGIHNYLISYDFVTMLPPDEWGFTRYGSMEYLDKDGQASVGDMLSQLRGFSGRKYLAQLQNSDPRSFRLMSFDPSFLLPVIADGEGDAGDFLTQRMAGFAVPVKTSEEFAGEGWQESMQAVAGLYGLLMNSFSGGLGGNTASLAKGAGFTLAAYAAERIMAEGRAETEEEALALAVEDIVGFVTGQKPEQGIKTVDDLVFVLAKYLADNEDSPAVEKIYTILGQALEGNAGAFLIRMTMKSFYPEKEQGDQATDEDLVRAFIRACACGPDPASKAVRSYRDAKEIRDTLYGFSSLAALFIDADIGKAIGQDENGKNDGSGSLSSLMTVICDAVMTEKDEQGNTIKPYSSLGEAADAFLLSALEPAVTDAVNSTEEVFGSEFREAAQGYADMLKDNTGKIRRLLSYVLLYTEGEPFETGLIVGNVCTFIENSGIFIQAHNGETYLAWAKAINRNSKPDQKQ